MIAKTAVAAVVVVVSFDCDFVFVVVVAVVSFDSAFVFAVAAVVAVGGIGGYARKTTITYSVRKSLVARDRSKLVICC